MLAEILNQKNEVVGGYVHGNIYRYSRDEQPKNNLLGSVGFRNIDSVIGKVTQPHSNSRSKFGLALNSTYVDYFTYAPIFNSQGEPQGVVDEETGTVLGRLGEGADYFYIAGKVNAETNTLFRFMPRSGYYFSIGKVRPIIPQEVQDLMQRGYPELIHKVRETDLLVKHAAGAILLGLLSGLQ